MVETSTPTSSQSCRWRRWWASLSPSNHHHHHRRWVPSAAFCSTHKTLLTAVCLAFFLTVLYWQGDGTAAGLLIFHRGLPLRQLPKLRPFTFNLTDFGGVGDGVTLNTEAFERAVIAISRLGKKGGGQLNVPPGNWLTAPFNLTSHMTLFLAEGCCYSRH
ncbi:putative polygalacturonase [Sesamum angolense]|uniref:Polygalacturonase n=1 Tax=Sesamum angolense TaxID=2727404 RepID=A0AAE1WP25_9LAMI|nr:putative polygalacturonase [Sesamum angolense]